MNKRVETRELTNADFAQRCAYLAKITAAWAGDMLTFAEERDKPVRAETVAMFTAEIRGWLDRIEQQVPAPIAQKEETQ